MSGVHCFRAMGCDVSVGGASAAECTRIEQLFEKWDRMFSRFRGDSELNLVNRSPACRLFVSAEFAEMVRSALAAAEQTGGAVDPTLGQAIEAAGYDRDFAALKDDPRPREAGRPGSWRQIRVSGRLLHRPRGVAFDLNGVVKSAAVDRALALIAGDGFVSAGGDIAARGGLDVALPAGGAARIVAGALATSGTTSRSWRRGGATQHHLIDPRAGRPARSPWQQVTVCGTTCADADVAAKAAFLFGEDGPRWLDDRGLPGRFVTGAGDVLRNAAWSASVPSEEPVCT